MMMLELFHGPTLAFKDFALQLLGRLVVNYVLEKRQQRGDLGAIRRYGSAAVEGCRHSEWMFSFFIHAWQGSGAASADDCCRR